MGVWKGLIILSLIWNIVAFIWIWDLNKKIDFFRLLQSKYVEDLEAIIDILGKRDGGKEDEEKTD